VTDADRATFDAMLTTVPQVNCVIEMGFGIASGSALPTDGVFFRYDAIGTLKCVMNTNGTETTSAAITSPAVGVMARYKIIVENDRVLFYIDGKCQSIIQAPSGLSYPVFSPSQPWFARVVNGATAPAAGTTLRFGYLFVGLQDAGALGKDNSTIAALQGRMGSQGQTGHAVGTTALLPNNLAPGAGAVMTNTTAALGVGLGGQFSAQPTLAVGRYANRCSCKRLQGDSLLDR